MTEESWFSKLEKKFAAAVASDQTTPEELEEIRAERKAMEDTRWEWAQMLNDGSIAVRISQNGPNGVHGSFETTIDPDDTRYPTCKAEYDLSKPGETVGIKKRWENESWVVELKEKSGTGEQ